jgi:hypothetical protein
VVRDADLRESVVEAYLVSQLKLLRRFGIRTRVKKIGGVGWRGWPDRMVLFTGGVVHWIELKRPVGSKFEPLQLRMHRELRGLDFNVYVMYTKAMVDAYIADLLTKFSALHA